MCEMQAGVLRETQKCVRRALDTATRRARRHREKNKVAEKHASSTEHKLSVGIIAKMKTKVSGRSDAGHEPPERETHHYESGESILQPPQQLKKGKGKGNEWTGYVATQPAVKFIEEQREEWAGGGSSGEGRRNIVEKPHPERKHSPGLQRDQKSRSQ